MALQRVPLLLGGAVLALQRGQLLAVLLGGGYLQTNAVVAQPAGRKFRLFAQNQLHLLCGGQCGQVQLQAQFVHNLPAAALEDKAHPFPRFGVVKLQRERAIAGRGGGIRTQRTHSHICQRLAALHVLHHDAMQHRRQRRARPAQPDQQKRQNPLRYRPPNRLLHRALLV